MFGNNNALIFGLTFAAIFICQNAEASVEFFNIKCESVDKTFSDFEYCFLKSVNRTYKYLSIKVKLFKTPVTNITIDVKLMKKTNGYTPVLFGITFDGCKFQRERKNIIQEYFYDIVKEHTNLNHTCPYDHDLIVEKMDIGFLDNKVASMIPSLNDEYCFLTSWSAYNKVRAHVKVFFKVNNKH